MQYTLIEDKKDVVELTETLLKKEAIYIDLEFDKNHFRYGFNLCLLQISDGQNIFLIDPLKGFDIQLISSVLESAEITKVCYAFGEDMRLLHHLGCFPKKVLDLATVRSLLNYPPLSLTNILYETMGVEVGKSQQKSNWCERPLSKEQFQYAAEDVLYLPKLEKQLMKEVEEHNRNNWIEEEMSALEQEDWSNSNNFFNLHEKEKKNFTLRAWMRYKALIHFRENLAAQLNRPSYKVIDKNILIDIAKDPLKLDQWKNQKRIHPSLRNSKTKNNIEEVLTAIEKEIAAKNIEETTPARSEINKEEKIRLSQKRKRTEKIKEEFFVPIKKVMINELGEHLTNYLFSNRRMEGIINCSIELLPYQKELLIDYANRLNLPTKQIGIG